MINMLMRVREGRLTPEDGLCILNRRVMRAARNDKLSQRLQQQYQWARFFELGNNLVRG